MIRKHLVGYLHDTKEKEAVNLKSQRNQLHGLSVDESTELVCGLFYYGFEWDVGVGVVNGAELGDFGFN